MAKAVKKPRKKATNGYKMPEPLPAGEILTDIGKNQWRLGTSIGKGGFGEIYSAQEAASKSSKYPFVIKVEPHENGPLFVEMHFYMKNAKKADIEEFKKKHKLKTFGMPAYIGSGSHEIGSLKYRFIVMEKFGADIDKLRHDNGGILPTSTVFQLAWQLTYVLEYIHEHDYVHADIKGGNVLMGITSEARNQAYLVDFGLATKFSTEKVFKANPKKAHDGTIEYLSRDAHQGVPTRRGDLEILGYNMVHWLCGSLPWESHLSDPKLVQQMKEDYMKDIPKFLKICFKTSSSYSGLVKFLDYVNTLKFNEEPNYSRIRDLFKQEMETHGSSITAPLEFHSAKKRRSLVDRETPEKKTKEEEGEVKEKNPKRRTKKTATKKEKEEVDNEEVEEVLTDAMKEILAKREQNALKKKKTKAVVNGESSSVNDEENYEGYTEEMKEIKIKKLNNEKKGKKKTETSSIKNTNTNDGNQRTRSRRNLPAVNYSE